MALIDVLNGMQNGPRGEPRETGESGGMSKTTMALLAFLAYKAYKSLTNSQPPNPRGPADERSEQQQEGGLAGILRTILGGGSVPGPVLRRGVENTVRDFEDRGQGDIARSWVARGPNRPIPSGKLEAALGADTIRNLTEQTGMDRDALLAALSQHLPQVIDHLTPQGRLPTDEEAARMA